MAKHELKNGLQTLPKKTTKPGTPPMQSKKLPVIGSGRNRPAKGFNQITKMWDKMIMFTPFSTKQY